MVTVKDSPSPTCLIFNRPFSKKPRFSSITKRDDLANSLVYNVFIAPVYAIIATLVSLFCINAFLFGISFTLYSISTQIIFLASPVLSIIACSLLDAFLIYFFTPKRCHRSLSITVALTSLSLGILSLYWSQWPLSLGWTLSSGALLGLNLHILIDATLLKELVEDNFAKMTTIF